MSLSVAILISKEIGKQRDASCICFNDSGVCYELCEILTLTCIITICEETIVFYIL